MRGVGPASRVEPVTTPHRPPESAPGFGEGLDALLHRAPTTTQATHQPPKPGGIHLSWQASDRLQANGVHLDDDDLADLGDTLDSLARRGAKESLVLMDDHAFLVRVADRTITTVMTRHDAAQQFFPVDSTAVVR
jgi:flagellar operon protein